MRQKLMYLAALIVALLVVACSEQAEETTAAPRLYVFSNSSPHVSVVDTATHNVVQTADIPDFTAWAWNDDNNFFDGANLWLGTRDPDTDEVAVFLLDLQSLEVIERIPLGTDSVTLYIGKPTQDGRLLVSKHASGQVAAIDIATREVLEIKDIPVNGGVACDVDVVVGSDGVERVFVPTDNGDTVLALDSQSLEPMATYSAESGTRPFMLTATTTKDQVWVQERSTNANLVLDAITFEVLASVPGGDGPITNTFSPDEQVAYVGHSDDNVVTVADTETLETLQSVEVGQNPQKLAVHPQGSFLYAALTREGAIAVIDTDNWQVTRRIPLGTNPSSAYMLAPQS